MSVILSLMILASFCGAQNIESFNCDFLGETPPGDIPKIFGPGTISTKSDECNFEISPNGEVLVFARSGNIIVVEKNKETGRWDPPYFAPFSSSSVEGECCFSPVGTEIMFSSRRPLKNSPHASNIWTSKFENDKWSEPQPFEQLLPLKMMHAISILRSGNIYDTGIIHFFKD